MTRSRDRRRLYYDPYDVEIDADPYPVYRRLREEAPLYYNERHDFFAVSRADDVERVLADHDTFISGRGAFLDFIRADIDDAARHVDLRGPAVAHPAPQGAVAGLHPAPDGGARAADPRVLRSGASTRSSARTGSTSSPTSARRCRCARSACCSASPKLTRTPSATVRPGRCARKPGEPMKIKEVGNPEMYADYIDWRAEHPSDDLMTELLDAEFEDETGTVRRLTREEILTYCTLIAAAGNETAATSHRLVGQGPGRPSRPAAGARRRSRR